MSKITVGIAVLAAFSITSCSRQPAGEPQPAPSTAPSAAASTPAAKAPTIVTFPGDGQVSFPAGTSQATIDKICNAIRRAQQEQQPSASSPAVSPAAPVQSTGSQP
jgi:hypothetical protein